MFDGEDFKLTYFFKKNDGQAATVAYFGLNWMTWIPKTRGFNRDVSLAHAALNVLHDRFESISCGGGTGFRNGAM